MAESTYFRRGFGLKASIEGQLASDYHSGVIEAVRAGGYRLAAGPLTFRLAKEFGFCYGVERAVDYAYQTRRKFPERRVFLAGEIIHNPHVNDRLREMGITFLYPAETGEGRGKFDFSPIGPGDVVILPVRRGAPGGYGNPRAIAIAGVTTAADPASARVKLRGRMMSLVPGESRAHRCSHCGPHLHNNYDRIKEESPVTSAWRDRTPAGETGSRRRGGSFAPAGRPMRPRALLLRRNRMRLDLIAGICLAIALGPVRAQADPPADHRAVAAAGRP